MTAVFDLSPVAGWRDKAACVGKSKLMDKGPQDKAKQVCSSCPVLADCQAWVRMLPLNEDPGGVCGGLTERERTGRGKDDAPPCVRDCKCSPCKERKARNRAARKAARKADPSLINHGTVSAYTEYRCRCEKCLPVGEQVRKYHRRSDINAQAVAS